MPFNDIMLFEKHLFTAASSVFTYRVKQHGVHVVDEHDVMKKKTQTKYTIYSSHSVDTLV